MVRALCAGVHALARTLRESAKGPRARRGVHGLGERCALNFREEKLKVKYRSRQS